LFWVVGIREWCRYNFGKLKKTQAWEVQKSRVRKIPPCLLTGFTLLGFCQKR
jgi:hypothetical protein